MRAHLQPGQPAPLDGYISVEQAQVYYRAIGQGQPIITLHGGPDFDHNYLLPDMDRLAAAFRLIYYDQRGRGKSSGQAQDVSLQSELQDLEGLRASLQLESAAILGHSWGGLLAMEYALRYPHRVSHLILMNTGPASHEDYLLFRQERLKNAAEEREKQKSIASTEPYEAGDPAAVIEYYRIHFRGTIKQPEHLERLLQNLSVNFTNTSILQARAIEERLMRETWWASGYNLLPKLKQLATPTLVIHGDYDFVPLACAAHIAQAIPNARLAVLNECGHFSYLECPDQVRQEITDFVHR